MKQTQVNPQHGLPPVPVSVEVTGAGTGRPAGASAEQELVRMVAAAGDDVHEVTEVMVRACAGIPHELIVLLLTDPALGGLRAARVRHRDHHRATVLQARLGVELRTLNQSMGGAGRTDPAVPVDGAALPEPVRAVLAEESPGPVTVVPVLGRAAILGVLVVARAGRAAFSELELDHLLSVGRLCGQALEAVRSAADAARVGALVRMLADAVISVDARDVVTHWNQAAEEMYGIPAAEATGNRVQDLIRSVFWEGDAHSHRAEVRAEGRWQGRVRQTSRSGLVLDVESRVSALRGPDGRYQGMVAVNRDMTAVVTAQADAQAQSRAALELMDALDAQAAMLDRSGRVTAANARWRSAAADRDRCVCGPVAEGENWLTALRAGSDPEARALAGEMRDLLRGRLPSLRAECACPQGGIDLETGIEVTRVEAGRGGAVVVLTPVVRRPRRDELTHRATHDELTGLPNRAALMAGLAGSLERLDGRSKLAVLFCDLDGFKDINDGLGHAAGDQVLVAVARRLRQRCRSADVVARFGGDEFVVVLSIDEPSQAVAMADRIVEVLAEPIVVGDVEVAPGVSVGITVVDVPPDDDDPVGTLLRDADTAMYHAKDRGRGRYELFDTSLRENIEERLELASALRRAVIGEELEVVYQSRRSCGDRRLVGVEALLRWRHPELGVVTPEVFIPIAERTGRVVELGDWVLRRALDDLAGLDLARKDDPARLDDPPVSVSVNVSARQLGNRLPHTVAAALARSGIEPSRLVLEITESALVDDPEAARAVLADLHELGVQIALDDFGTGWSSLQYLRTLPVDVLKVDRTFVADLPASLEASAVVSAVLNLAHGLGLVVVAEGVEDEETLQVLRGMGCDEYQGFIDGDPGPLAGAVGLAGQVPRR